MPGTRKWVEELAVAKIIGWVYEYRNRREFQEQVAGQAQIAITIQMLMAKCPWIYEAAQQREISMNRGDILEALRTDVATYRDPGIKPLVQEFGAVVMICLSTPGQADLRVVCFLIKHHRWRPFTLNGIPHPGRPDMVQELDPALEAIFR